MDPRIREVTRLWTLAVPVVSAFITSLVRDFQDRDDVLQDVAVAVVESFDQYDPARPFVAWALGVARNQVRLHFRRKGRDRVAFDTASVDALAAAFSHVAPEDTRKLDRLRDCVQALDEQSRELCRLRYERDLKPAAIGERLGIGANAVAKSLQRIRDRLRACVESKGGTGEVRG
jgi:RNA polymerase sigma-70 factor (ECF subfamily)